MKIALAVFVKTPGISPIKTRLAKSTSKEFASEFYERSVLATSAFLKSLQKNIFGLDLFWAVAEEQGLSSKLWSEFQIVYQGEGGLGERLHKVYCDLIESYDAVFFMGADSPHLSCEYITKEVKAFLNNQEFDFLLGSTSDGGYYLFGGKKSLQDYTWLNVRYSSTHTSSDFSNNLKLRGDVFSIKDSFDIDEKNDLDNYSSNTFVTNELLEEQKNLIDWVKFNLI